MLAAYVVTLAVTVGLGPDHVRPLYDGFAPPPAYRWMEPPPFFASGNVKPTPVHATIKLDADGSAPAGIATPDGQFVINLGRGAIAPHSGSSRVAVKISPVAPSRLAKIRPGLRANGNAYRVEMTYGDGTKVGQLAKPGSLVLEIPELGSNLFVSSSGTRWSEVTARAVPPRQLSLTAPIGAPGYYLAATSLPELVAPAGNSADHSVQIGIGTALLAAALLGIAFVLVRRRRCRAEPAAIPTEVSDG
ncbi:MAG: hypothetical protein ACXV8R_05110 [Acidimicrobiia bacterium]